MRNIKTARADAPTVGTITARAPRNPVQTMTIPHVPPARMAIGGSVPNNLDRSGEAQCPSSALGSQGQPS
ncbi:hypothetical protein GCM10023319_34580 [Nocardia iowensis]